MANPTTYFGWVMPNSADLVTDLPADFNVFGQGVDTSMQDLLGGTTGQILSKTSGTNMDFTWINNDQGDITAVTAGTGITGGGTSGAVTITNDMATTITTAGDLIKGTGSGTYNRLGIGSTSQVLTVVAGAPAWATPSSGGMTLISTTTLSGASVTLSSIPAGYVNLVLTVKKATNSTADGNFAIEPNALGATGYNWVTGVYDGTAYAGNSTRVRTLTTQARANDANALTTTFYNHEQLDWTAFSMDGGYLSGDYHALNNAGYCYVPTSAITSLKILNTGGNWASGTAYLYGVK